MQVNQKDREKLLQFISEVSFALIDVNLFLDTHPYDEDALEYYEKYKRLRREAMKEYSKCYGPLLMDDVDTDCNKWQWVQGPWPWEGGC